MSSSYLRDLVAHQTDGWLDQLCIQVNRATDYHKRAHEDRAARLDKMEAETTGGFFPPQTEQDKFVIAMQKEKIRRDQQKIPDEIAQNDALIHEISELPPSTPHFTKRIEEAKQLMEELNDVLRLKLEDMDRFLRVVDLMENRIAH